MHVADCVDEPRHPAPRGQCAMKPEVQRAEHGDTARRRLLIEDRIEFLQRTGVESGHRLAQRQRLESSAHLCQFKHVRRLERRRPHAPSRFHHGQPLRFQPPERLAYRHMARAEFGGDVVLTQPLPGAMTPEMMRSAKAAAIRSASERSSLTSKFMPTTMHILSIKL